MRGKPVCLRTLGAEERAAVEALARSRTDSARRVERARIVWRASRGETPPTIATALGVDAETVRRRIRRFNADGLAALEDRHRSGRPATYSAEVVAVVIATALTSTVVLRSHQPSTPGSQGSVGLTSAAVPCVPNAPRAQVEHLLSSASVFWSATGFGQD